MIHKQPIALKSFQSFKEKIEKKSNKSLKSVRNNAETMSEMGLTETLKSLKIVINSLLINLSILKK